MWVKLKLVVFPCKWDRNYNQLTKFMPVSYFSSHTTV